MKYFNGFCLVLFLSLFSQVSLAQEVSVDTVENKVKLTDPLLLDEVVAVIGNKMILLSDIYTQQVLWKQQRGLHPNARMSEKEKLEIFESLMLQKVMAVSAIADSLPVSDAAVLGQTEERISRITTQLGSVKALEEMLHAPLYQIREMFGYQIMEESLARAAKGEIMKNIDVTPLEVKKFAKGFSQDSLEIIPRQVEYAHIVKLPPSDYDTKMKVRADLLELRRRITNGESFSALARLYSEEASKTRGGEMDYSALEEWVAPFADAVRSLKIGGVSGIVETIYGFHIIQLIDIKNGMYKVRHILRRISLDADALSSAMLELDSVAVKIRNGEITFKDAVHKYSNDAKSKTTDGMVLNIQAVRALGAKGQSAKMYEDELGYDAKEVLALKVGEISDSFVTSDNNGNMVCKIITLIGDYPAHKANAEEDYSYFEDMAKNASLDKRLEKWLLDKISKTYIHIEEPYASSKFKHPWVKKSR